VTRVAYVERARSLFESLAAVSAEAAGEAVLQAGLAEVFVWGNLTAQQAHALSVACQLRLLEVA
jgi:hypothetical protein